MNRHDDGESFFRRWSRVKTESRDAAEAPPAAAPEAPVVSATSEARAEEAAPELPPIEKLTLDSDFSGFFHPKVDEDLRRRALRKLFSDPHFNVMDGLDTYIDDYSKTEPIPPAMLASLKQAQRILEWAADNKDATGTRGEDQPSMDSGSLPDEAPPALAEDATADSRPQTAPFDSDDQAMKAEASAPAQKT